MSKPPTSFVLMRAALLLIFAMVVASCSNSVSVGTDEQATPTEDGQADDEATVTPLPQDGTPEAGGASDDPTPGPAVADASDYINSAIVGLADANTAEMDVLLALSVAGTNLDTTTVGVVDRDLASVELQLTGAGWAELVGADTPGVASGTKLLYILEGDSAWVSSDPADDAGRPWQVIAEENLTPTPRRPAGAAVETDPRDVLTSLRTITANLLDARIVGTTTIGGVDTNEISGVLPMTEAYGLLPARQLATLNEDGFDQSSFGGQVPASVWISEDGVLVRMRVSFDELLTEALDNGASRDLESVSIELTATLTSIGQPVTIEVPSASQIADPNETVDPDEPTVLTGNAGENILNNLLVEGSCYTSADIETSTGDDISCSGPHIAEVFHSTQYPEGFGTPYPGEDDLIQRGGEVCNSEIADQLGVRGEISVLRVRLYRPSPESWGIGDRELSCFVQYPEPITDRLAELDPLRSFGTVSPFGLEVGDCLVESDLSVNPFTLADCTADHFYEVFVSAELDPGPYPGDDEMDLLTQDICLDAFEEFVGAEYETSQWFIEPLSPDEGTWTNFDDRLVSCLLTTQETTDITAASSGL